MKTVTVAEMKEIERRADESGLSYYQMMENAGIESYRIIKETYPNADTLFVFCGKGNNGGDGLVVARLAANDGKSVHVILVEGIPVTKDAKTNYDRLPESVKVTDISETDRFIYDKESAVVIDALYGTGFHGSLRSSGKLACEKINSFNVPVISLDIPSGCSADSAEVCKEAVDADITVVFHAYKHIHELSIDSCGKCELADIGIK